MVDTTLSHVNATLVTDCAADKKMNTHDRGKEMDGTRDYPNAGHADKLQGSHLFRMT
jgi:hypothetical protein